MTEPTDRTLVLPLGDELTVSCPGRGPIASSTKALDVAWLDYVNEHGVRGPAIALDEETIDRLIPVLFRARDNLRAIARGEAGQLALGEAELAEGRPRRLSAVYS
jgi:hypothetical protein